MSLHAILAFIGSDAFDMDVGGLGLLVLAGSLVYSLWRLRRVA